MIYVFGVQKLVLKLSTVIHKLDGMKEEKRLPNKVVVDLNVDLKMNKQMEKDETVDTQKDVFLVIQVKTTDILTINRDILKQKMMFLYWI